MIPVIDHLQQMAEWFNSSARDSGLDVALDPRSCLPQLRNPGMFHAADMMQAYEHCRVTEEQVGVAVRAIARIISQPRRSGLIDSKQDEGSAGTAIMLMFACPVGFLISGIRHAPLYLTANEHRRLGEARGKIRGFLRLYGDIGIIPSYPAARPDAQGHTQDDGGLDLVTYLYGFLEADRYPSGQDFLTEIASAVTARRMPGGLAPNLEAFRQRANGNGYEQIVILDHTLCASGRSSGAAPSRPGPVLHAFAEIDASILDETTPGVVVGISSGTAAPSMQGPVWKL